MQSFLTLVNGEVNIELTALNNFIEISVHDTGIGIADEVLEKISQNNFYTTNGTANESGTGLGLTLCNEFLRKNGSKLKINSKIWRWKYFSFKLPLQQECILVK